MPALHNQWKAFECNHWCKAENTTFNFNIATSFKQNCGKLACIQSADEILNLFFSCKQIHQTIPWLHNFSFLFSLGALLERKPSRRHFPNTQSPLIIMDCFGQNYQTIFPPKAILSATKRKHTTVHKMELYCVCFWMAQNTNTPFSLMAQFMPLSKYLWAKHFPAVFFCVIEWDT